MIDIFCGATIAGGAGRVDGSATVETRGESEHGVTYSLASATPSAGDNRNTSNTAVPDKAPATNALPFITIHLPTCVTPKARQSGDRHPTTRRKFIHPRAMRIVPHPTCQVARSRASNADQTPFHEGRSA